MSWCQGVDRRLACMVAPTTSQIAGTFDGDAIAQTWILLAWQVQNSKAQFEEHADLLSARHAAPSQDEEDREPETAASEGGCNVEESSEVRSVATARPTLEEVRGFFSC